VIVVDNGSVDGTPDFVRAAHPGARLLALADNWGAAACNLGVAVASTTYVAFCDDDTWWAPGSLSRVVDLLASHLLLAVLTARIVVEPGGTLDPICDGMARSPLSQSGDVPGAPLLSSLSGASVVRPGRVPGRGWFRAVPVDRGRGGAPRRRPGKQ
jgi:glycosyltransferase involved in cell wall biosynthesis